MDNTYYPPSSQPTVRTNALALISMLTGLGGWFLYLLSLCPGFFGLNLGLKQFTAPRSAWLVPDASSHYILSALLAICLLIICAAPVWVVGLLTSVASVFTGLIAIKQIKDGGNVQRGRGMAIAGLIAGYTGLAITLILIVIIVLIVGVSL